MKTVILDSLPMEWMLIQNTRHSEMIQKNCGTTILANWMNSEVLAILTMRWDLINLRRIFKIFWLLNIDKIGHLDYRGKYFSWKSKLYQPEPEKFQNFSEIFKKFSKTYNSDFATFLKVFYSFTEAPVINMNDYTPKIQFHHWNELFKPKRIRKSRFFSYFDFSKLKNFSKNSQNFETIPTGFRWA